MALTGNEILFVQGVLSNGNPSGQTFQTTTGAIAALGGSMASTPYSGQVKILVTGTAVQLDNVSNLLVNGLVITAGPNNSPIVTTAGGVGGTFGFASNTNNLTDGTGNGQIISPGSSTGVVSGVNLNTIYVNGVAGDIFSFAGN